MTEPKKQESDKPKQPNEVGKIKVSEMIKIVDAETKEVIVEKKA